MPPDIVEEGLAIVIRAELGGHMLDSKIKNDDALIFSLIIISVQKLIRVITIANSVFVFVYCPSVGCRLGGIHFSARANRVASASLVGMNLARKVLIPTWIMNDMVTTTYASGPPYSTHH